MAHCFSVVDNFDGKFVKAIIELPFKGEFVTDEWLPNILVNKPRTAEEIAKTSTSVCFALALRMNEATTLVTSFLSSHQMPGY